jgi:hypothetical protein
MGFFPGDCPRCGVKAINRVVYSNRFFFVEEFRGTAQFSEAFSECQSCKRCSISVFSKSVPNRTGHTLEDAYTQRTFEEVWDKPGVFASKEVNILAYAKFQGDISLKDTPILPVPESTPADIAKVMAEGNACLTVSCWNAAGAMYRTALDLATKSLLPDQESPQPSQKTRRSLGLRIEWLLSSGLLPIELGVLAEAVREDGNDGAHDATLSQTDALDLYDFSFALMNRLFTEPARISDAAARRKARRDQLT